jgi:hypothetical protein
MNTSPALMSMVNGSMPKDARSSSDLQTFDSISAGRFLDRPPPERQFLAENILPLGIVATAYSRGGVGKSLIALDLCIRTALGVETCSNWLCKYPVVNGGRALYLSAEEGEEDLGGRVYHIARAVANEGQVSLGTIEKCVRENLGVLNYWGSGQDYHLFKKEGGIAKPSEEYESLSERIARWKPKLVVFDTRSRFSGLDENDNALVASEVALYERLAKLGPTVLILHHSNKSSYQGGNENAGAFRGASAWQDNIRCAFHFQSQKAPDGSGNLVRIENPKNNYCKAADPFVIRRLDEPRYGFELADLPPQKETKDERLEGDLEKVVEWVRGKLPGPKTKLAKQMRGAKGHKGALPWNRCLAAIDYGVQVGELRETEAGDIMLASD